MEVPSILSFGLTDTLGTIHRHHLRNQLLPRHRTDSNSEAQLIIWESTDRPFDKPHIRMVAITRWLGSVARRRLGGPMAAVEPGMEKADKVRAAR